MDPQKAVYIPQAGIQLSGKNTTVKDNPIPELRDSTSLLRLIPRQIPGRADCGRRARRAIRTCSRVLSMRERRRRREIGWKVDAERAMRNREAT